MDTKSGKRTVEQQLIAYGVEKGSFDFLLSEDITTHFFSTYGVEFYEITKKSQDTGIVPSKDYLEDKYPRLPLDKIPQDKDVPLIIEELRENYTKRLLQDTMKEMNGLYREDKIEDILELYPEKLAEVDQIAHPIKTKPSLSRSVDRFNAIINKAKENNNPKTAITHPHPVMSDAFGGYEPGLYFYVARPKNLKCLEEGTDVLTPNGPVEIQNLVVGDTVYGYNSDGSVEETKVKDVFNQGIQPIVDLSHRGRKVAACTREHRWLREFNSRIEGKLAKKTGVFRLKEFKGDYKIARRFIKIPCGNIKEPHSYSIGAMLGDGCCREWSNCSMAISSEDENIPKRIADNLGSGYRKMHDGNYTWKITNTPIHGKHDNFNPVVMNHSNLLKDIGSPQRDFPLEIVDSWDRESLLAFTAGLIDTDGGVYRYDEMGSIKIGFSSTSKKLRAIFDFCIYKLFQIKPSNNMTKGGTDTRDGAIWNRRDLFTSIIHGSKDSIRILEETSKFSALERKKLKPEDYEYKKKSWQSDTAYGFSIGKERIARTWDIHVDNDTNLYLLANQGLITHNTWSCLLDAWHLWKRGLNVLYFSLEIDEKTMMYKFDTLNTGFSNYGLSRGWFSKNTDLHPFDKKTTATKEALEEYQIYAEQQQKDFEQGTVPNFDIVDRREMNSHITIPAIEAKAKKGGVDALFIDQLGHVDSPLRDTSPDHVVLDRVSLEAKKMTERLGIPVIVAHQMNRETEKTKFPTLSNIAGSDGPGRHADAITLLTKKNNTLKYNILGMRNGVSDVQAAWYWNVDNGIRQVIDPGEVKLHSMTDNISSDSEDDEEW